MTWAEFGLLSIDALGDFVAFYLKISSVLGEILLFITLWIQDVDNQSMPMANQDSVETDWNLLGKIVCL